MIDQAETKEDTSKWAHGETPNEKKVAHGNKGLRRKAPGTTTLTKKYEVTAALIEGVGFTFARDGPDLYLKAMKRLGLFVCATYKNGSDLEMCLEAEDLILPEMENPNVHQRKTWDLQTAAVKNITEANDGVAFMTVSEDKEEPKKTMRSKRWHFSDARKSAIMQVNVKRDCPPRRPRVDLVC